MPNGLDYDVVQAHLQSLVPPRPSEMEAMEDLARERRFPIVGPAAGHFCYLVARLIGARRVFEMGSGYGYSTAWFARAVQENGGGTVYHVVWDQALSDEARVHLARLGLDSVVRFVVGEAVQTLRDTEGPFDLIFDDIDKQDYPASLPVVADRLRHGGVLLVDNMLWHGRIFDDANRAPAVEGVRELSRLLSADPSWISSIVPIRDGVLMAVKNGR